jgi:hypothetical protein
MSQLLTPDGEASQSPAPTNTTPTNITPTELDPGDTGSEYKE